jgi:tRNA A37 methylthiotransferase MiaB
MESSDGVKKEISAFVISNGCHECFIDAALVQKYLRERHGFATAENAASADVIVLLGCAVMQPKEDQTRELIHTISEQKRPDSQLLVCGCITKVRPEITELSDVRNGLFEEIENLIALKGQNGDLKANFPYQPYRGHKKDLLGTVRACVRRKVLEEHSGGNRLKQFLVRRLSDPFVSLLSRYKDFVESKMDVWNTDTYTIKISTGCRGSCSYCSIKQSRGSISSKPVSCVVEEFRTGLQKGYRSLALIGTDIGDYGKDRGEDLLDLLRVLIEMPEQFLLRLRNVNPRWIIRVGPQFRDLLRSGKIAYMEAPIQSASERILRLMNRGYTAEAFLAAMHGIKQACPTLLVKTQVIVGFPGESQEDFQKSLDLFEMGLFDYVDVFRYSDRPNTRASELPEKVPGEIAMRRYRRLFFKSLFQLAPRTLILNRGRPSAPRECSDESVGESE